MPYEVEDEIDWSDGTLDEPCSTFTAISADSGYVSPAAHEHDGLDYLFEPQKEDQHNVLLGTAYLQRARVGKAYEATFLKHFVNHALHPSQIEQCFHDPTNIHSNVQKYIASVSANVNGITNKMTWNAHCRTVNLLANAGKDGAPFWDVSAFDRTFFADFGPSNASLLSYKMKESWHLTAPEPPMVRYTTRDYPIGHHSSPFEEIDEVAGSLFSREAFGSSLPTGRVVKQPTKRKAKGQGLPGASTRPPKPTRRDNWLASLIPPVHSQGQRGPSPAAPEPADVHVDIITSAEPRTFENLRQLQAQDTTEYSTRAGVIPTETLQSDTGYPSGDMTQLEQLFQHFGTNALCGRHPPNNIVPNQEQID
ncbi:hypothetical protein E8E12_002530 [Didymella heteroderae]|uniref:Uncharacterized protein n=1 Tax=Didymella heteroderae TaxID=1769908 RepID=A0A9P4WM07_9PLEO|nr:hypothetical protein E8E12_002530 [Didymella heteroderae]